MGAGNTDYGGETSDCFIAERLVLLSPHYVGKPLSAGSNHWTSFYSCICRKNLRVILQEAVDHLLFQPVLAKTVVMNWFAKLLVFYPLVCGKGLSRDYTANSQRFSRLFLIPTCVGKTWYVMKGRWEAFFHPYVRRENVAWSSEGFWNYTLITTCAGLILPLSEDCS